MQQLIVDQKEVLLYACIVDAGMESYHYHGKAVFDAEDFRGTVFRSVLRESRRHGFLAIYHSRAEGDYWSTFSLRAGWAI